MGNLHSEGKKSFAWGPKEALVLQKTSLKGGTRLRIRKAGDTTLGHRKKEEEKAPRYALPSME